jgi:HD-GYP domain-containing protein (c-di-GMP phosphodiesterase class II)
LQSRIALLAQVTEIFYSAGGPAQALKEVYQRSGTWFDPRLVTALSRAAGKPGFWSTLKSPNLEKTVMSLEPASHAMEVDDGQIDIIAEAFAEVIDSKSPFTSGHSDRVAIFADAIAAELGFSSARRRWLRRIALLHDIGKLGVSNAILDKPGKLTDEEWTSIRRHPVYSRSILERISIFASLAPIAGAHHERLDGRGYPDGISADRISIETRIITTADVFDALTADRPYRKAMSLEQAMAILEKDRGTAIDGDCLDALKRAIENSGGALLKADH